jgi:hypothetical protein
VDPGARPVRDADFAPGSDARERGAPRALARSSRLAQGEEQLFDVGCARAHTYEAALLEDADRANVARRDPRVERARRHLVGKLAKRARREPLAPELLADPVADETPPLLLPAPYVASHLAFVDDRLLRHRVIGEEPAPVGVERLAIAGRENRHPVRLRLALILEERVEVALDHVPQNIVHSADASAIGQRASLREPVTASASPLPAIRFLRSSPWRARSKRCAFEKFLSDYVRLVLVDVEREIASARRGKPAANFLSALGLLAYTEVLGGIKRGTMRRGEARRNFDSFFGDLGPRYRRVEKSLRARHGGGVYVLRRCGLAHQGFFKPPGETVKMKDDGVDCGIIEDAARGKYTFVVERYYHDFKVAAEKLKATKNGQKRPRFPKELREDS